MKKEKNERTELVKVETLETEICFEIIELEDALLGDVIGGVKSQPTNGSQCSCSNGIAC